jgi:hypothetical protein
MVRMKGLEPPHISTPEPKSGASTNFATSAKTTTGTDDWTRTNHTRIFSPVLYPMSYVDISGGKQRSRTPSDFSEPGFQGQSQDQPPLHYFPFFFGLGSRNRTYAPTSQTSSDTISPYRENINWESFVARRAQPWAHGAVVVAVELLVHRWHLLCL